MFIDVREKERKTSMWEKYWLIASSTHPNRGLNPQPRLVPWPGIEPKNFSCMGWLCKHPSWAGFYFSYVTWIYTPSRNAVKTFPSTHRPQTCLGMKRPLQVIGFPASYGTFSFLTGGVKEGGGPWWLLPIWAAHVRGWRASVRGTER